MSNYVLGDLSAILLGETNQNREKIHKTDVDKTEIISHAKAVQKQLQTKQVKETLPKKRKMKQQLTAKIETATAAASA